MILARTIRFSAVCVALAVFALRALVPAGWMPNVEEIAPGPFAICTGGGPASALSYARYAHDHSHEHPGAPDQDRTGLHVCPFGAAPHFAATGAPMAVPQPAFLAWFVPAAAVATEPRLILRHAPQSARAPPLFA
jgi:hypothetical protein